MDERSLPREEVRPTAPGDAKGPRFAPETLRHHPATLLDLHPTPPTRCLAAGGPAAARYRDSTRKKIAR